MKGTFLKHALLLLFGCPMSLGLHAQRKAINNDWEFVRLQDDTADYQPGNQGSDWASQFNIQNQAEGPSVPLPIPTNQLTAERNLLNGMRWEQIRLPHSAYIEPYTIIHPWQGVCYYRRNLPLTPKEQDGNTWIEFEGAMQLADIWINGRHVMQHAGGIHHFRRRRHPLSPYGRQRVGRAPRQPRQPARPARKITPKLRPCSTPATNLGLWPLSPFPGGSSSTKIPSSQETPTEISEA